MDSTYERTYSHVVQNSLKIGPLGARHLGATYTCISSNNNVSAPVSRKVSLDILFPPTDVSISSVGQPLVAGTTYVISCEAAGSRPDPVISWWLASDLMKEDRRQIVEKVGEVTKSTIYFTPTTKDHGKILACRAENPLMSDSGIDDNWSITVYCECDNCDMITRRKCNHSIVNFSVSPRVNLNFGVPLNAASIKEGQDIFFRCSVEANPQVYKIEWRHDVSNFNTEIRLKFNLSVTEQDGGSEHRAGRPHQRLQPGAAERDQGPGRELHLRGQQPRGGRGVQQSGDRDQM